MKRLVCFLAVLLMLGSICLAEGADTRTPSALLTASGSASRPILSLKSTDHGLADGEYPFRAELVAPDERTFVQEALVAPVTAHGMTLHFTMGAEVQKGLFSANFDLTALLDAVRLSGIDGFLPVGSYTLRCTIGGKPLAPFHFQVTEAERIAYGCINVIQQAPVASITTEGPATLVRWNKPDHLEGWKGLYPYLLVEGVMNQYYYSYTSSTDVTEATLYLAPGEEYYITLGYGPDMAERWHYDSHIAIRYIVPEASKSDAPLTVKGLYALPTDIKEIDKEPPLASSVSHTVLNASPVLYYTHPATSADHRSLLKLTTPSGGFYVMHDPAPQAIDESRALLDLDALLTDMERYGFSTAYDPGTYTLSYYLDGCEAFTFSFSISDTPDKAPDDPFEKVKYEGYDLPMT